MHKVSILVHDNIFLPFKVELNLQFLKPQYRIVETICN